MTLAPEETQYSTSKPITSDAFTPPDGSILVAYVMGLGFSANWAPAISDTETLTWAPRITHAPVSNYKHFLYVYTAPVTTGASMTVSFTPGAGGFANCHLIVLSVVGGSFAQFYYDNWATSGQASGAYNGDFGSALDGATSYKIAGCIFEISGGGSIALTEGTGWTEDYYYPATNGSDPAATYASVEHITGTTDTGVDYAAFNSDGAGRDWGIGAIEISVSGGGGGVTVPVMVHSYKQRRAN